MVPSLSLFLFSPFILWGNHCGPGHGSATVPPIDALDAACARHDACLSVASANECACHLQLERELEQIPPSSEARLAWGTMLAILRLARQTRCAPLSAWDLVNGIP